MHLVERDNMARYKSLGERIKRYESVTRGYLAVKTPVIMRLDGKAFHTFTKGMNKPFDARLMTTMQRTMLALCEDIEGCVLGYTQSDEITLVIQDYNTYDTAAWYEYRIDKMCSVAASKATRYFNKFYIEECGNEYTEDVVDLGVYESKKWMAEFDCRVFNVPKEEVCNVVLWRQQDASKNSIQMLAQSLFKHNELQNLNCSKLQDKMFEEKGVNWNDLAVPKKRGTSCIRGENGWVLDKEMPILTEDRNYVDSLVYIGD